MPIRQYSVRWGRSSAVSPSLGWDHVLFGSDMPFDPEKGPGFIRETIRAIEAATLAPSDREKIYEQNARRLLKLPK